MSKPDLSLDSLPDDILKEILIRVPAQDILAAAAMLVCRKWYRTIRTRDFAFAQLRHSTPGLLIRIVSNSEASFMSMTRSGRIEISSFSYSFTDEVWSSCNGLMLENEPGDDYELRITNPLTKRHFTLPPLFVRTQHPDYLSAIAYVATQMDYKVVRTYCLGDPDQQSHAYCAILTVGVDDSWRLVDTQHISLTDSELFDMCPLVTDGFVHWSIDLYSKQVLEFNGINNYVLTLNMETEIITRIPAPRCNDGYYYYKYLSSGGSYLSLLIGRGYLKWEVWEMKPETGEWKKLPDIDLEAHKGLLNDSYDREESSLKPGDGDCLDCKLLPVGWLKYRDVIAFITYRPIMGGHFCQSRLHVVYNVQTQDVSLFELDYHMHPFLAYRGSLIGIC